MNVYLVNINLLKKYSLAFLGTLCLTLISGCGAYNFTGGDVGTAVTFQVDYFQNYATQSPGSTFDPGLDREFTLALQDLILTQTRMATLWLSIMESLKTIRSSATGLKS